MALQRRSIRKSFWWQINVFFSFHNRNEHFNLLSIIFTLRRVINLLIKKGKRKLCEEKWWKESAGSKALGQRKKIISCQNWKRMKSLRREKFKLFDKYLRAKRHARESHLSEVYNRESAQIQAKNSSDPNSITAKFIDQAYFRSVH